MPSAISNAVGTARQFTPQPDNVYQGRYNGVRPERVFARNADMSLSQSLMRLSEAFNAWRVGHERMLDVTGRHDAERMIRMETPEDVEKLDVIDAAQSYGFVDETANPYFRAYADKLRGGFLSSKMKQAYDEKYAMTPAKSMDEEAKRFTDFAREWADKVSDTVENRAAFNDGYNEAHLSHIGKLWSDWQQKKRQEDAVVTMASATNRLGEITENTPKLLAEGGVSSVLSEAQSVWNETRLMGLPAELRVKLLQDWSKELVQSGRMNREQIGELMGGLVVQTHMDGSATFAANLLNMMDLTTAAAKFHGQFLTQQRQDAVKTYIQGQDKAGWTAYIEGLLKTNPEEAVVMNQYTNHVFSSIDRQRAADEAAARRQMQSAYTRQDAAYKAQQDQSDMQAAIDAWMHGGDSVTGQLINQMGIKKENAAPVYLAKFQELVTNDDFDGMMQLLSLPLSCAGDLKKMIGARIETDLNGLRPDNVAGVDEATAQRLSFYAKNADSFAPHLSDKLVGQLQILQTLSEMEGGITGGLADYAVYRSTPEAKRKEARQDAEYYIEGENVYDVEGIQELGGGFTTVPVTSNADVSEDVLTMATVLGCTGMTGDEALNRAAEMYAGKYVMWRGAAIPVGVLDGLKYEGVPEPRLFLERALEDWAGDYPDARYDRRSRTFYFMDGAPALSLRDLYENAKILYAEQRDSRAEDVPRNDTPLSVDEINAAREDRMGVPAAYEGIVSQMTD